MLTSADGSASKIQPAHGVGCLAIMSIAALVALRYLFSQK